MGRRFVIAGRKTLLGNYPVQGNKNAALPLLAASLLAEARVVLHNVPKIVDVLNMVRLLEALGATAEWKGQTLVLDTSDLKNEELPQEIVEKLRGAILLLGALAPRFGEVYCGLPGGCPIGRRSFDIHWSVFRAAGYWVKEDLEGIQVKQMNEVRRPDVYLEETSVTATENALILFAAGDGGTIENPAREPHVLSVVEFLQKLGCEVELEPLRFHLRCGVKRGTDIEFTVPGDFIDAGTIAIAAAVTNGQVHLDGITRDDLIGIEPVLRRFGIQMKQVSDSSWDVSSASLTNPPQVTAGLWPQFPTDLVSLAIVLASQAKGLCLIHDWMYEARMFFVDKLVRMGARITMCDPHRVLVEGRAKLRGVRLESPDIRAGMALVVAGLCARGETVIEHAEVIQRGYEMVVQRLSAINAGIREEES